jgi:hypothetical protein
LAGDFLEVFLSLAGTIAAGWDSRKWRAGRAAVINRGDLSREAHAVRRSKFFEAKFANVGRPRCFAF